MENLIKLLSQFSKENKFYWINALVKQGEISESLAGHLIVYFNL